MRINLLFVLFVFLACSEAPQVRKLKVTRVLDDSHPYHRVIEREAKINEIDPRTYLALLKVESRLNPKAVSDKDAHGLAQLRPYAQRKTGVSNPYDPIESIKGGARWLYLGKKELKKYGMSVSEDKLLAWYYCGINNMMKNKNCGKDYAAKVQKQKEAQG